MSLVLIALSQPWGFREIPVPEVSADIVNPYEDARNENVASLEDYRRFYDAAQQEDRDVLGALLARDAEDFLTYRVLLTLARSDLPAAERAGYYRRAFRLKLVDPLARGEARALQLERAQTAERAGFVEEASNAYAQALPLGGAAVAGLERLEPDPLAR